MEQLSTLFEKCVTADYIHVEKSGDYAIQRNGDILYLFLEKSDGTADWLNNFRFLAKTYKKAYKNMETKWRCHRGFLSVWKAIEPYVKESLLDPTVKEIIIVGYSHGAALAGIAHEYVWFNRPDLREHLTSFGFGAPRFYGGYKVKTELKERWKNFYPIRNHNDIVTHLPPKLFGYCHVNQVIKIGKKSKYNVIDSHRWQNIYWELVMQEKRENDRQEKDD